MNWHGVQTQIPDSARVTDDGERNVAQLCLIQTDIVSCDLGGLGRV